MTPKQPRPPAPPAFSTEGLTHRGILEARAQWLSASLDRCTKAAKAAVRGRSFVAASSYDREARVTRKELDDTLREIATLEAAAHPAVAVTPEAFTAAYTEWLTQAPIEPLERAVEVWAQRIGAVLVVEGGRARIVYRDRSSA
jgi:hypothetical protein